MGWTTDDGCHEGFLELVLADGTRTSSTNSLGPFVMLRDETGRYNGEDDQRSDDEVVAWQLRCDHYTESGAATSRACWDGPTWQRVVAPALEDLANGRIYARPGQATDAGDREDVDRFVRTVWETKHAAPQEDLATARRLREEIAAKSDELTRTVARLRAAGQSWEKIGQATGMARQSAQQRWGSTDN